MLLFIPNQRLIPLLLISLVTIAGCGFSIERVKPAVTVTRDITHYESPEDCYEAMTAAASRHDFEAALDCMTIETQQQLGGFLLYQARLSRFLADNAMFRGDARAADMRKAIEGVDEVFAAHNIDDRTLKYLPPFTEQTLTDGEAMRKLGKQIKELHGFTSSMLTLIAKLNPGAAPLSVLDGELTMDAIDEDAPEVATGVIVAEAKSEPVEFRRVEGGWQIVLEVGNMTSKRALSKPSTSPKSTSPRGRP
ncbi:hypothetical protein [Adhaeretor mobilis]|uniref:Uncharacterized protein n=1 Tax=Adhaeretor mobilis TaxID=1930276 RepID=A0A517MR57_9BACT|nr:hypothetical protein [Adhaeretor mobilis]QDS97355.1 hypothetical protein HG15A2_06160 [Adhaeretor mobilis]